MKSFLQIQIKGCHLNLTSRPSSSQVSSPKVIIALEMINATIKGVQNKKKRKPVREFGNPCRRNLELFLFLFSVF